MSGWQSTTVPDAFALVTGSTGFIASRLVPALVSDGWRVRATGRRDRPDGLPAEVEYRPADLAGDDAAALAELCAGVTHVFHLAGASSSKSSQEEMDRNNVEATARLLDAAASGPLERFLHMSSTSVYGEEEQLPLPVREDVEPHPSRGYGKAKWGAEQQVWARAAAGVPVAVLRPVTVYGPGATKLLASAILDTAIERAAGLPRLAVAPEPMEQRLVHVDDLVAACVHLARSDAAVGRAFNVVDGIYPSSHDVAAVLAGCFRMDVEVGGAGLDEDRRRKVHEHLVSLGMDPAILFTPDRLRLMTKTNRNNRLSTEALESTGFRFARTDFAAAVADNVAWYRAAGWLPAT
ncbi:MAG TPA: NAD-dependent epimerase/dehydratase family protein [Acidimicrobiales bacterium]|nr:NAD-dependent epimerase/dehydratase family protein [Acidimicrobiales bacterium]